MAVETKEVLSEDDIQSRHCSVQAASIELFHRLARFGGRKARLTAAEALENDLATLFHQVPDSILINFLNYVYLVPPPR